MPTFLTYDDAFMRTPHTALRAVQKDIRAAHGELERLRTSHEQGFFDLPSDLQAARVIEAHAARLQKRFHQLLVIGIGGSDLGARALYQAVGGRAMWLRFLTNPDPDVVAAELDQIDWKQTAVNVVSKSGTTLETMALFEIVRQTLAKHVGKAAHREHMIATTEESESSVLYALAKREGYAVAAHPTNVGGRFSALSVVALLPLACSGLDIRRLLAGAAWMESCRRVEKEHSLPSRFTTHHAIHTKAGRGIHVLMPYAPWLSSFSFWYRQLWAESLGKLPDVGPTPVAALGPQDQHSQIQLYHDGPDDKVITFIEVDRFKRDIRVSKGPRLSEIIHAERAGTAEALFKKGKPNGTIHIPSLCPESLGALMMFYETAVAYMGQMLGVNAFDQPGVEHGKKLTREMLTIYKTS